MVAPRVVCAVCGAAHASCGGPTTTQPVDIPGKAVQLVAGEMVIIDRGDGHTFQFRESDAEKFLKANPGSQVVGDPPASLTKALEMRASETRRKTRSAAASAGRQRRTTTRTMGVGAEAEGEESAEAELDDDEEDEEA